MVAVASETIQLDGLARNLCQGGLLDEEKALQSLKTAARHRIPLVSHLVNEKILASKDIAHFAAAEFGMPLLDLDAIDIEEETLKLIDEKLIQKLYALPLFKRGTQLFVAISDPHNLRALDEFKFHAGANAEPVLVEEDKLARAIESTLDANDTTFDDLEDAHLDDIDISSGEQEDDTDIKESDLDDTPVVRFVNKVLLDAINKGASDIHFEPFEKLFRIRFRQDGILKEITNPPIALAAKMAARIKVMSKLNISERRVPQDGRMKMTLSKNRAIDFRVSTCPTLWGEKIVLRILDPTSAQIGIDALGYEEDQKNLFLEAINKPYGMVLVTGPTGSGKTVSLYTALNILNTEDRNISTAEDPAEITLPGVNQVNVRPKVGLTFSAALKSFLRQDPDVIMVGEIRDIDTAEIAIKAAQTGHMVLSTLHTNDAPQTLSRLANMGVAPFNIASAVSLIIAQRLARRLCPHCKEASDIPKHSLLEEGFTEQQLEGLTVFSPKGCDQCTDGYKGRVGIYQVMPVSAAMGKVIMDGGNALQIKQQATEENVADLRQSGLKKVAQGITSLDELNRVTTE